MSNTIDANTLGECWLKCIDTVIKKGSIFYDEDAKIKEILGLQIKISSPNTSDEIISKFGDQEVILHTLKKFSKGIVMENRPFTYGNLIYNKNGVDQFEWLVDRLNKKKETKSATICLLKEGAIDDNLPCLTTIDAKIRDGRLNLQFFFRSQNVLGRQYANLLAIAKLQADLAGKLLVKVGFIAGYIASAHIYEYDFEMANLICQGNDVVIKDNFYSYGPKSIRKNLKFRS